MRAGEDGVPWASSLDPPPTHHHMEHQPGSNAYSTASGSCRNWVKPYALGTATLTCMFVQCRPHLTLDLFHIRQNSL